VHVAAELCPTPSDRGANPWAETVAIASKFVASSDGDSIFALVRVLRGTLAAGASIFAMGNDFAENRELHHEVAVRRIAISHVRYMTLVASASAGMVVKVDADLHGICVLADVLEPCVPPIRVPAAFVKVAVEPLDPSKLQTMVESITKARLCYPSLEVIADANGDHCLLGTGELFLDCALCDIRTSFARVEVKVSDPFVVFRETVGGRSVTICRTRIDDENTVGFTAEPMRVETLFDLEEGKLSLGPGLAEQLLKLGWDEMAADGVWAFSPDSLVGPNILVNDTLPPKPAFSQAAMAVIGRSFAWSCRVGPLCDEMMHGVVFRIVEAEVSGRSIIPAVRKGLFAAFLAARPRIVEPVDFVEVMTPVEGIDICTDVLKKRRGQIIAVRPLQGTTLHVLWGNVPLIDSFGLEVQLRSRTAGQAFPLSDFEKWDVVPGDPLDASYQLRPLEPAPNPALAREFVVKTRRRKGLGDEIDISKYADEQLLIEIAAAVGQ
jgi:U5 small nuclear ribonucleoprotein component